MRRTTTRCRARTCTTPTALTAMRVVRTSRPRGPTSAGRTAAAGQTSPQPPECSFAAGGRAAHVDHAGDDHVIAAYDAGPLPRVGQPASTARPSSTRRRSVTRSTGSGRCGGSASRNPHAARGQSLLGLALDVLAGLGATEAILHVDDDQPGEKRDRTAANKLYESAGFAEADRLASFQLPGYSRRMIVPPRT